MSTINKTQEKIEYWKNHPSAGFHRNFCPDHANGLSRIAALEMSLQDFIEFKNFGPATSYELLMALNEPLASNNSNTANFAPILRSKRCGHSLDFPFSVGYDTRHMIDFFRESLQKFITPQAEEQKNESPEQGYQNETLRIMGRLRFLMLNIMDRLLRENDSSARQLILQELRGLMLRLQDKFHTRIVPELFMYAVGSIWWIISDHDIFELMFKNKSTINPNNRLKSFYCDDKNNNLLYKAISIVTASDSRDDVGGMRIYPSIIPEKYGESVNTDISIPFSFVFEFRFVKNYEAHRANLDGMNNGVCSNSGEEGIIQLEYIHPCPSTCPPDDDD